MKNTPEINMSNFFMQLWYILTQVWAALTFNLEKILAIIGGFVGLITLEIPITENNSNEVFALFHGLLYACIYAAAGWTVKQLLDSWKKKGFKLPFTKKRK